MGIGLHGSKRCSRLYSSFFNSFNHRELTGHGEGICSNPPLVESAQMASEIHYNAAEHITVANAEEPYLPLA